MQSINTHRKLAILNNHRQVIRLEGETQWCFDHAQLIINAFNTTYFWVGNAPTEISTILFSNILGQETELLIFNALLNFDANLFAAAEGTLKGGGLLVLLTPQCINKKDFFYQYIDKQLAQFPFCFFSQDNPIDVVPLIPKIDESTTHALNLNDQNDAIIAIKKTITGHQHRPLVLTANRGRGKSAALGIACAHLLIEKHCKHILICAPSKRSVHTAFKHSSALLPDFQLAHYSLHSLDLSQSLQFIAPDTLLADKPHTDLLIIDEAAALPVPLLESLTKHYTRLIFSSTLHGYEGSGRGFALRFQSRLKELSPQYRKYHLTQPIRWAENDPLESFTLNSICLTQFNHAPPCYHHHQSVEFQQILAQELLQDKKLLQTIFALLVDAHYQTKPSDLCLLLNGTDLSIFVMQQSQQIIGVALINHEGQISDVLSDDIYKGKRRIKGNLIPQSLAFHSGFKEASSHRFARIQRIAIYPSEQNKSLGTRFIAHLKQWAITNKFDHICTVFGATAQLTRFWQHLNFSPLRMGATRDKSSGAHSLIMSLPLTAKGKALNQKISKQCETQFLFQLSRNLQSIDPLLVMLLLKNKRVTDDINTAKLHSYLEGERPYQYIELDLVELILTGNLIALSEPQQKLCIEKVLQNHSWVQICKQLGFSGKKQAQQALKNAIKQLIGKSNAIR
ncbi:MAG: tRNA(Met) cytidine acetyltransferase [Psychromonas sp.]|nr:tRNA(Met) cytidine acetyltransferase [Psychromonas sp.]